MLHPSGLLTGFCIILILICEYQYVRTNLCTSMTATRTKYQSKCGWWGWDRCTRYRTLYKYVSVCCPGYDGSLSSGCSPICHNNCHNRGDCSSPNYCTNCQPGYYSPHCNKCTAISNCEQVACTTAQDQYCMKCNYDYSPEVAGYLSVAADSYPHRECQKQCSWLEDSQQCYPGKCGNGTCECAPNFSNPDCRTILDSPAIPHCEVSIMDNKTESVDVICNTEFQPVQFTNMQAQNIKIHWKTQYKGPEGTGQADKNEYKYPVYIEDFDVGVISTTAQWTLVRRDDVLSYNETVCDSIISQDNPQKDLMVCDGNGSIPVSLKSGDALNLSINSTNGGRLLIKYYTNSIDNYHVLKYYSGQTRSHVVSFVFDFDPPYHCLQMCTENMLEIGQTFTSQATVPISWDGWADAVSGVALYQIEIYKFKHYGSGDTAVLDYKSEGPLLKLNFTTIPSPMPSVKLAESGLYCVLLIVYDNANKDVLHANHRLARRFVMYDNSSKVESSNHSDHRMIVTSASANTSYEWITNLNKEVNIQWKGHFFNAFHRDNYFLNAIAPHHIPLDDDYEEREGQPPTNRSMESIPNINGIYRFDFMFATDHNGGRSLNSSLYTWEVLSNIQEEEIRTIPRVDGESIRFWVKAYDVMNNTLIDDITVHIDSSPPVIDTVGIIRNGHRQLMVHSNVHLFDLVLAFEAYDYHSGIKQVTWNLTNINDFTTAAKGALPVHRSNVNDISCSPSTCYCIPRNEECFNRTFYIAPDQAKLNRSTGIHDSDYLFIIKVVNNAMLETVYNFQITIDVSPPLAGHVFDGELGQRDRDYQSNLIIHGHWEGFFDRESGIRLYKYGVHHTCLNSKDFEDNNSMVIKITMETFITEHIMQTGTYYISVVGYNQAMTPSHPVCSDGVTIDLTHPLIQSVHVKHAYIKPGLVLDAVDMMYMDEEGYVYDLRVKDPGCKAKEVTDLSLFEYHNFTHPIESQQRNCSSYGRAGRRSYLAVENWLEIYWTGSDPESTIQDYMVALSSTTSADGDIMPYLSTHGHQHFLTYHPNLADHQLFYVQLRATNKAGIQIRKTIGPYEVRVNGPVFDADITVTVNKSNNDNLIVHLGDDPYSSSEIENDFIVAVEYSLGENSCTGNMLPWTVAHTQNTFDCKTTWPPKCFVIDTKALYVHLHDDTQYCVQVRTLGANRLVTTRTKWYRHVSRSPKLGLVWEVQIDNIDEVHKDIDYQTSSTTIQVKYIHHNNNQPHRLTYYLSVGTTPFADDTKKFELTNITEIIELHNLNLKQNNKYFTTMKAVDSVTHEFSLAVSDGITILTDNIVLSGLLVYDGIPCDNKHRRNTSMNHHLDPDIPPPCGVDVNYQTYTTVLSIYWTFIPSDTHIHYFLLSVEKLIDSNTTTVWKPVKSDQYVGNVSQARLSGLYLEAGETYHVTVKGCHPAGCYKAKATDGVLIIPLDPIPQDVVSVEYNDTNDTVLAVTWKAFADPYLGINLDVVNDYAIAVFVQSKSHVALNQVTKWIHLQTESLHFDPKTNQLNATIILEHNLEASACLVLGMRGYNRAMLYSTSYKEFLGCATDGKHYSQIMDAVGKETADGKISDISFNNENPWSEPDAEFTSSKTSLSAVWPTVRHGFIRWSVVHGDYVNRIAYQIKHNPHLNYWDFDCTSSQVLACGSTYDQFVNVHDLVLEEGSRYHICIYGNETSLIHGKWEETLAEVSVCSDGVTVDTKPPIGGHVWVGHADTHSYYQIDNLALAVHWDSFVDVEIHERSSFHSGIKSYSISIGSINEGRDVLDYKEVGLTNMKIINGLKLKNGKTYFVTVKAEDYSGLETKVTSDGFTIDLTPPIYNQKKLIVTGNFLSTENHILIDYSNGAFYDPESGIEKYLWCIGTKPYLCDAVTMMALTDPVLYIYSSSGLFISGQEYHVLFEAFNGAGMSRFEVVTVFMLDTSYPSVGFIYEVASESYTDIDYQISRKELHIVWGDFSDPESHIVEYRLTIGSCQNCTDILNDVYVGLVREYHLNHLSLEPGVRYYTSITCCNSVRLCTSVTSDGLVVDETPPHLGKVYDGITDLDMDYQSKSNIIQAHLENVHDIQSKISVLTWWAGSSLGDDDIFVEEATYSHTVFQNYLNTSLPEGTTVFVSVKACNNAGLCTNKSSDGSTIDTSPPYIMKDIELIPGTGSITANYQVYRNTLGLQWLSEDDISPITVTYLSVLSHDNAQIVLPTLKLAGNPQSCVLADLDLSDGDLYTAKLSVCNAAHLCTHSESLPIIVDSSPPTSGAFAVDTDHAVDLDRHRSGWMTYNNNQTVVKLAWVGFQDPHSDIGTYFIKIGTSLYGEDIAEDMYLPSSSDVHEDEGCLEKHNVLTKQQIIPYEDLYISIYAVNKAGLQGQMLHGLFTAIPSAVDTGTLSLVRRCSALSCSGHCMCAPHGFHGCDVIGSTCSDKSGSEHFASVTVNDVIPGSTILSDVDYIPSMHILQAEWDVDTNGMQPLWYDWSVGIANQIPGSGLLNLNLQLVWHEAGTQTTARFSLSQSMLIDELMTDITYIFHVRAWYNDSSFAIFTSDGVQVDQTAPELSDSYSVIDVLNPESVSDIDFTSSDSAITIKWRNVFRDDQSGLVMFLVRLYSNKIHSEIKSRHVDPNVTEVTFTDLKLKEEEHYVSQIVACNNVGLCTQASSDGFVVDTTPPYTGSVIDGSAWHDIEYFHNNHEIHASWQLFNDDESFIDHYVWCITIGTESVNCANMGLQLQGTNNLPDIKDGETVQSSVYAVNGANMSSVEVYSNGVTVDFSPPMRVNHYKLGINIVKNPYFHSLAVDWEVEAKQTMFMTDKICLFHGEMQQEVKTIAGQKYRLMFNAVAASDSTSHFSLGHVYFGHKNHHIISAAKESDDVHLQIKAHYVIAHGNTTMLKFETLTDAMICIGNIVLEPIQKISNTAETLDITEGRAVHVDMITSSTGVSLVLAWHFEDFETMITDYMIAVGTIKGGIQIQKYRSVGISTTAEITGLALQHNTTFYVTVVATNAAGLSSVAHAEPVVIDLTPPVVAIFKVNDGIMSLASTNVSVEWTVTDSESEISSCEISIEYKTDRTVLFHGIFNSMGTEVIHLITLNHGDMLTCTLICQSIRKLFVTKAVGPLTYINRSSIIDKATVSVIPMSETFYQGTYDQLPLTDSVWFRWDGMVDLFGRDHCELTLHCVDEKIMHVQTLGMNPHHIAGFLNASKILMEGSSYRLKLVCVNKAGHQSEAMTDFMIDSSLPVYNENGNLHVLWSSDSAVHLNWSEVFQASSTLVYEINLGSSPGGSDVLAWIETKSTEIEVTQINSGIVHYLTISAINKSGLYITKTFQVHF